MGKLSAEMSLVQRFTATKQKVTHSQPVPEKKDTDIYWALNTSSGCRNKKTSKEGSTVAE